MIIRIKTTHHLLQSDTSGRSRVYVQSKLISQCPSVRCVDGHSEFKLGWFLKSLNYETRHYVVSFRHRLPGTRTLCDALVHILSLVQIYHLDFVNLKQLPKNSCKYQV